MKTRISLQELAAMIAEKVGPVSTRKDREMWILEILEKEIENSEAQE